MRILITGVAGFLGSPLAEHLLAEGHEVVGLDSFDSFLYDAETKQRNVAAVEGHPGFRLVRGDILHARLLKELATGVDVVAHLAALAGVRPSLADPARYVRTNVEGTVQVLEACRAAGVQRLVFASSSSVYGARGGEVAAFVEDDPCLRSASPYAATKRAGELLCATYRDLYGLGSAQLRFFTVYGPRQRPEMAIHQFTRLIATGKTVTLFGDGSSARDYTYIDDIIDGTRAACLGVEPGLSVVYNLGGSRTTTLLELVRLIGNALGEEPVIEFKPDQPGDVPITYADVTRAGRALGYAPRVPIDEGIRRFVAWYRASTASSTVDAGALRRLERDGDGRAEKAVVHA
jgi:UDP-glucuronate 4-epimerase